MEQTDSQIYFVPDPERSTLQLIEKDDNDQFELELAEIKVISHDTNKYIFKLPSDDQVLGLNVCGHMVFHIQQENGDFVSRKYTPVSCVNEKGTVAFVIKTYKRCEEFPNGGKISQHLASLRVGDKMRMEGPMGLLNYMGHGKFLIKKKPVMKTKIGIIAGGTGITPCFQLIQASTLAKDGIEMVMIYSNKTKDDILVKKELDELQRLNPENLKIYHTLTRHSEETHGTWDGLKGRISVEMLKECRFPEPSPETLIVYCGPAPFNKTVEEVLTSLGYDKDMMHKF